MDDLVAQAQQIGIQSMIDAETKWRDEKIAALEAELASRAIEPWRRAIGAHWGDEVLKATTPDDAVRAAYFKGLRAQQGEIKKAFESVLQRLEWDGERLEKNWLGPAEGKAAP